MKLEPVFLVAPEATSKSMSTRRVFLIASATFGAGLLAGEVHGRAAAAGGGPIAPAEPTPVDDELAELRRLAVDAPIEELVAQHMPFLFTFVDRFWTDPVLIAGVERLARHVLDVGSTQNPALPRLLTRAIDRIDPAARALLQPMRERLERMR